MRNGSDTENDRQCYRYEANAEYRSNLYTYIADTVRENQHHHDKREHTAQMTVSMIPTHKLSQPHKYGYEYNNRRQRMGDQSNQQDDNGIQHTGNIFNRFWLKSSPFVMKCGFLVMKCKFVMNLTIKNYYSQSKYAVLIVES